MSPLVAYLGQNDMSPLVAYLGQNDMSPLVAYLVQITFQMQFKDNSKVGKKMTSNESSF